MAEQRTPRLPPKVLCPRCGEVAAWAGNPYRPFCSERCKMIDLGAWASGEHRIPGKPLSPEDQPAEGPASDSGAAPKDGDGQG